MKQLKHQEIANIKTTFPIVVICDSFHSPQNVGMAFRICEIMGIQHLYLTGDCPTLPNSKIKKTARNGEQLVPYSYKDDPIPLLQQLKQEGFQIVGIEIADQSQALKTFEKATYPKIALLFGSERFGISPTLLSMTDQCFHIPMYGQISSMNVVMAMSISLYEITKQLSSDIQ